MSQTASGRVEDRAELEAACDRRAHAGLQVTFREHQRGCSGVREASRIRWRRQDHSSASCCLHGASGHCHRACPNPEKAFLASFFLATPGSRSTLMCGKARADERLLLLLCRCSCPQASTGMRETRLGALRQTLRRRKGTQTFWNGCLENSVDFSEFAQATNGSPVHGSCPRNSWDTKLVANFERSDRIYQTHLSAVWMLTFFPSCLLVSRLSFTWLSHVFNLGGMSPNAPRSVAPTLSCAPSDILGSALICSSIFTSAHHEAHWTMQALAHLQDAPIAECTVCTQLRRACRLIALNDALR